jgi:hypothetical protein
MEGDTTSLRVTQSKIALGHSALKTFSKMLFASRKKT